MSRVNLKYFYWEDSKLWVYLIFFFLVKLIKLLILIKENIQILLLLIHLNTLFSLPLIFLFKNRCWSVLILYFVFQKIGRILLEFGYRFFYFNSDYLIQIGLLLKLGLLPLIWWFPFFLKNNNWFNFFFFNTLKKISLFYLISYYVINEWLFWIIVSGFSLFFMFIHSLNFSKNKSIKVFFSWRSLLDGIFFIWLSQVNFFLFLIVFIIYRFIQLKISLVFFFSLEKKITWNGYSLKFIQYKKLGILKGLLLILLLIGFPTFVIFLFKIRLIYHISPLFKSCYWFLLFFFFVSMLQRLIYMKLFFQFLVKIDNCKFSKYHYSFLFSLLIFFFFNFFFFFFLWLC
jgi:hypothetical protein